MNEAEAWLLLERGRSLEALRHWRGQLLAEPERIALHMSAAEAGLAADPLVPLRRQALQLLHQLLASEPGASEQSQLGLLLRGWGELCLSHAPARAQQHFERAWACGHDGALARRLADLYARQGMATGALALGCAPTGGLPPWPQPSCAGLHCLPCQQQLEQAAPGEEPPLQLIALPQGRIWIERNSDFAETHGVGVADQTGVLQAALCRRYPWQWPGCAHQALRQQQTLEQLAHRPPAPVLQLDGPVLAVADLSAELYFHAQLELLPRLGRAWQALAEQLPSLRLWHNGGRSPWLQEAFCRLGIPPEQVLCAHRFPHLQAQDLLVPSHPSPFGAPGAQSRAWLQQFWGEAIAERPAAADQAQALLLSRPPQLRRPLLHHNAWQKTLGARGFAQPASGASVARQLQALQRCEQVVAAHGGAMANLLLLGEPPPVLELANPAYAPPYFAALPQRKCRLGAATPEVLQDLLYAGPLEWPIDLPPP
jgi:hypothetical protein